MKKVWMAVALAGVAATVLASCGGNPTSNQSKDSLQTQEADSAVVSGVDSIATEPMAEAFPVWGTFKGTLPCADCPGLVTTLIIESDGSYTLVQEFEKKGEPGKFEYKGMATFDSVGNLITLPIDEADSASNMVFQLSEPDLIMLHETNDSMTPEEEAMYKLTPVK